MTVYSNVFRTQSGSLTGVSNKSGSTCGANLCLVHDVATGMDGSMPAVMVPTLAMTLTHFVGVSNSDIPNNRVGDVFNHDGDQVVCKGDGAISIGDRLTISTTASKLGYVKATTSADDLAIGYALTAGVSDGDPIVVSIQVKAKDS